MCKSYCRCFRWMHVSIRTTGEPLISRYFDCDMASADSKFADPFRAGSGEGCRVQRAILTRAAAQLAQFPSYSAYQVPWWRSRNLPRPLAAVGLPVGVAILPRLVICLQTETTDNCKVKFVMDRIA
jgi:hypothetical protein